MNSKIEVNDAGIVLNPGIHDAAIIETHVSGEGENVIAIIRCRSEQGILFTFRAEGVQLFSNSFFGSQNIINGCLMLFKKDANDLLSEIKDLELYTFERIEVLNERIKKGDLTFLRFSPSVGAQIDCVCKIVTLEIYEN